jgi:hypothetical protein
MQNSSEQPFHVGVLLHLETSIANRTLISSQQTTNARSDESDLHLVSPPLLEKKSGRTGDHLMASFGRLAERQVTSLQWYYHFLYEQFGQWDLPRTLGIHQTG